MASRTCPACQRRYAGLIDPDCVICDGVGVLSLGAPGLHKNEPAVVARAIEVYLEATARNAAERHHIGPQRTDALAVAMAELRHGGLVADTLATKATVHDLAPAPAPRRRTLVVVGSGTPHPAVELSTRCGVRPAELPGLKREDLIRDLIGWSLIIRSASRFRITPLPDDLATLILDHPPGPLFPTLTDEYAHAG